MTETRSGEPYFSHIRLTVIPTQKFYPTGKQLEDGSIEAVPGVEFPGILFEIIPFISADISGPAFPLSFGSKKFFEDQLARAKAPSLRVSELTARNELVLSDIKDANEVLKTNPNDADAIAKLADAESRKLNASERSELATMEKKAEQLAEEVANIEKILNNQKNLWVEDLLSAGHLPALDELFVEVFSDSLDTFEQWKQLVQDGQSVGGIPVEVKMMQWEAKFPPNGQKIIELIVGVFTSEKVAPAQYKITFDDATALAIRQKEIDDLTSSIEGRQAMLNAIPQDDPQRSAIQSEIDNYTAQKEEKLKQKASRGSIKDVLSKSSVEAGLPKLLITALQKMKSSMYPNLNVEASSAKLIARLEALKNSV